MKQILFLFIAVIVTATSFAQQAEVTKDASGTKVIKGFMTQKDLSTDPDFAWYAENQKGFTPDANAVSAFTAAKDSVHFLVFGGTWCGDTKNLLPKFFALTDAAKTPQQNITMIGVDRSKKTLHNLTEAFQVTRVPTIIVLKNGKEIGRVVEYGRMGMIDRELGEIVSGKK
jgi:thiol-disulfide isomerase/thioredoxin